MECFSVFVFSALLVFVRISSGTKYEMVSHMVPIKLSTVQTKTKKQSDGVHIFNLNYPGKSISQTKHVASQLDNGNYNNVSILNNLTIKITKKKTTVPGDVRCSTTCLRPKCPCSKETATPNIHIIPIPGEPANQQTPLQSVGLPLTQTVQSTSQPQFHPGYVVPGAQSPQQQFHFPVPQPSAQAQQYYSPGLHPQLVTPTNTQPIQVPVSNLPASINPSLSTTPIVQPQQGNPTQVVQLSPSYVPVSNTQPQGQNYIVPIPSNPARANVVPYNVARQQMGNANYGTNNYLPNQGYQESLSYSNQIPYIPVVTNAASQPLNTLQPVITTQPYQPYNVQTTTNSQTRPAINSNPQSNVLSSTTPNTAEPSDFESTDTSNLPDELPNTKVESPLSGTVPDIVNRPTSTPIPPPDVDETTDIVHAPGTSATTTNIRLAPGTPPRASPSLNRGGNNAPTTNTASRNSRLPAENSNTGVTPETDYGGPGVPPSHSQTRPLPPSANTAVPSAEPPPDHEQPLAPPPRKTSARVPHRQTPHTPDTAAPRPSKENGNTPHSLGNTAKTTEPLPPSENTAPRPAEPPSDHELPLAPSSREVNAKVPLRQAFQNNIPEQHSDPKNRKVLKISEDESKDFQAKSSNRHTAFLNRADKSSEVSSLNQTTSRNIHHTPHSSTPKSSQGKSLLKSAPLVQVNVNQRKLSKTPGQALRQHRRINIRKYLRKPSDTTIGHQQASVQPKLSHAKSKNASLLDQQSSRVTVTGQQKVSNWSSLPKKSSAEREKTKLRKHLSKLSNTSKSASLHQQSSVTAKDAKEQHKISNKQQSNPPLPQLEKTKLIKYYPKLSNTTTEHKILAHATKKDQKKVAGGHKVSNATQHTIVGSFPKHTKTPTEEKRYNNTNENTVSNEAHDQLKHADKQNDGMKTKEREHVGGEEGENRHDGRVRHDGNKDIKNRKQGRIQPKI